MTLHSVRARALVAWLSTGFGLAALVGCHSAERTHAANEAPPVRLTTTVVHVEPMEVLYRASGTVRGHSTAVLTSKTTGYVRAVNVKSGDRVTAGQALATLEANDARAALHAAEARLAEVEASQIEAENGVKSADSSAVLAKSTRDRSASLLEGSAISQQDYDDVEHRFRSSAASLEMARAHLKAVGSRIEAARAEVAAARATVDYATITAPFAGRVLERRVDPGALATPGMALLVVEDDGRPHVEASVDESRGPDIKLGDTASLEVELDGRTRGIPGTVSEIVPAVDVASRAFLTKIELPAEVALRPGAFVRAIFRVGAERKLIVPAAAVSRSGALERVFVVKDGRAQLRMITTGDTRGERVVVLSGLDDGEEIVSPVPGDLRDGTRLEGR